MLNIFTRASKRNARWPAIMPTLAIFFAWGSIAAAQDATPAVSTQSPATVSSSVQAVSSYRINPGDVLEISVWGEERLQRQMTVLPDGSIAFPLVGQLKVLGALPQDVEAMVRQRLADQYRGEVPSVTVSVSVPSGMTFSILGKVRSPGTFTTARYVNVLEALSLAGGADEFARVDNIILIRGTDAEAQTFRVRLGDIFRAGVSENDIRQAGIIRVEPGDVIIVP